VKGKREKRENSTQKRNDFQNKRLLVPHFRTLVFARRETAGKSKMRKTEETKREANYVPICSSKYADDVAVRVAKPKSPGRHTTTNAQYKRILWIEQRKPIFR
jgi:hypothetical protein